MYYSKSTKVKEIAYSPFKVVNIRVSLTFPAPSGVRATMFTLYSVRGVRSWKRKLLLWLSRLTTRGCAKDIPTKEGSSEGPVDCWEPPGYF